MYPFSYIWSTVATRGTTLAISAQPDLGGSSEGASKMIGIGGNPPTSGGHWPQLPADQWPLYTLVRSTSYTSQMTQPLYLI